MIECGFDAGDCGTDKYDQLHGFMLLYNQTHYHLPKGRSMHCPMLNMDISCVDNRAGRRSQLVMIYTVFH